nr:hypothetical protein [Tanacetum cinerariifolium]
MRYGGICFHCKYDTNPNSLNFSDYPLQSQYETNICALCGNGAHYGYDYPPQVPFVYNQNPCFDQNFNNNFPLTSSNFSQQNLVWENYGGPHATFQCQLMIQNFNYSNSFSFDQIQPPQQFVNHQPQEIPKVIPFIESKEWIETKNELYKMMDAYTERMNQQSQEKEEPPQNSDFRQLIAEMCGIKASAEQKQKLEEMMLELLELCQEKELYCMHDSIEALIGMAMNTTLLSINLKSQRIDKEKQEVKNILEQATKYEVIKSSIKNLVPIPSESEVNSDNKSECDVPIIAEYSLILTTFSNPLFDCNDDFTSSDDKSVSNEDVLMENFKIYSNPLFDDEEIISTKIDPHYFSAESNLLESLLNRDTLIDPSPKFDYLLEEFSGELAHSDPIPPGIEEANFDLEEEIRIVENLLYDNSSPRPPKELNLEIADTILESLSLFPVPVEDSDSHMEEIDLFLATDDLMPLGIENEDYDSEGDIYFLEELLSNDTLPLLENKSSNFDHHDDPSFPRPHPEPSDVEVFFDLEVDTGVLTTKVVKVISEHYVLMPNTLPTLPILDLDLDFTLSHDSFGSENKIFDPGIFIEVQSERLLSWEEFSISFIRDPLYPVFDTLLPFSSENEDKVFKPGILSYLLVSHRDKITFDFSENPMTMYGWDIPLLDRLIALDFKYSRARGFVHRPLELQSLAYVNPIS